MVDLVRGIKTASDGRPRRALGDPAGPLLQVASYLSQSLPVIAYTANMQVTNKDIKAVLNHARSINHPVPAPSTVQRAFIRL